MTIGFDASVSQVPVEVASMVVAFTFSCEQSYAIRVCVPTNASNRRKKGHIQLGLNLVGAVILLRFFTVAIVVMVECPTSSVASSSRFLSLFMVFSFVGLLETLVLLSPITSSVLRG